MNVLILGGTAAERMESARAVHQESRTGGGALVVVDARLDDERVRRALEAWISDRVTDAKGDVLRMAELGTLFVDSVASLSNETQRLMLEFTRRRSDRFFDDSGPSWFGRLAVGDSGSLATAVARGRFSALLYDALDKIRIELPRPDPRGRRWTRSCHRDSKSSTRACPAAKHSAAVQDSSA